MMKNIPKTRHLKWALLAGFAALPTMAVAQSAEADAPALGDIVVTAQKREQKLQDVPIQVTAIGAATIETAGIKTTADALQLVPNVTFDQSFTYLNSFITVRGISQINNADPPVAIVVDGVALNNQKQLRMDLFDIERIEVLKGPQGGLYGRNALGGAINIVTRQPTNAIEGFASASYGNGDAIGVDAGVSGPISADQLLFRLSGSYKTDNGRIENVYRGDKVDFVKHDWGLRGQLSYVGSDRLKVDLRGAYRDFAAGGVYDSYVASGNTNDVQAPRMNLEGLTFGHVGDVSFKFDYDLGAATLTGITSYSDILEKYRGDLDFSNPVDLPGGFFGLGIQAGQGQDLRVKQTSQELRLTSPGDQSFRWIAGAYYLHTARDLRTRAFIDFSGSRDQYDVSALRLLELNESNSNNAYSGFGQFDLDLTDALTVSGALRYDRDDREQTNVATGAVRKRSFDSFQPKLTLTYKPAPGRLVYATFGTGFRSGGFNAPTVAIPVFKAEKLENYEVGFKTSWMGGRVLVNGAIFLERDHDYQFFFVDASTASQIIGNIDRVNIWGVELDVQAQVATGLQIGVAVGTTETEIKKSTVYPTAVGNHTPKTTPWTLNANAQYSTALTDTTDLVLRVDYQRSGKRYWQLDNSDIQRPINLVNARAGIDMGQVKLFLWGRNLLNKRYYADYNPAAFSGQAYDIGSRAQPRTYGVEAKVSF